MFGRLLSILVIVLGLGGSFAAHAQDMYAPAAPSIVSEIRAGIFAHDVTGGFLPFDPTRWNGFGQIEDINVEILFTSPDAEFMRWIGSPMPNLGGTFSLDGQESMAHLALTWHVQVFETPFFIEGSFGAALNNGTLTGAVRPLHNMGCHLGFYESASLGYDISDNLTATLTYEHTSNLSLCSRNEGLSNMGMRVGYKF